MQAAAHSRLQNGFKRTVFRDAAALLWLLLTLPSPGYLALRRVTGCGLQTDGVLSSESDASQGRGCVFPSLASLLGQGVFWQMDVLQTIINQGHPD